MPGGVALAVTHATDGVMLATLSRVRDRETIRGTDHRLNSDRGGFAFILRGSREDKRMRG